MAMSIISGRQDVTNQGEPMSFTDSLLESLQQAPVLGKDSGERALPYVWNNPRKKALKGWKSESNIHLGG